MRGQQMIERYQNALMNTFGTPQRILIRGQGVHVWDIDGNHYIDLLGGIAVNALGHGHPAILKAVTDQLNTLGHISNFFASEPQIVLAEKLIGLLGTPAEQWQGKVFFSNSGTEANETALKATRRTGRTKIIAAEGCFHGRTLGALALTSKAAYREPFEPLPGDVQFVPYGDVAALAAAVDETVAAVLLEPIQGEAGVIEAPAGYLEAAREITSAHGALLWLDEVQTGIGRTGAWFAHTASGIVPDLITLAKGLGGGIPIGACIAVGAAGDLLQPGNHGTTFGGNPVATAAGIAVLDTIETDNILANVLAVGEQIRSALGKHPLVSEVTGRGLLLGVVLTRDVAAELQQSALDAGVIVNNPKPNRIRLAPPLVLTSEEADDAVKTLMTLLDEIAARDEASA